jgi:hypothetical protein
VDGKKGDNEYDIRVVTKKETIQSRYKSIQIVVNVHGRFIVVINNYVL